MKIDIIDNIQKFNDIKTNWSDVYAADKHATFFVSWPWLRGWFETIKKSWFIIALRNPEEDRYVAFLPLRQNRHRTHILMAGNDIATHTGIVCLPQHENTALELFANYIQSQLKWDIFSLKNVSDIRIIKFLPFFSPKQHRLSYLESTPCPYLLLPENWNDYLHGYLGKSSRQNLKRRTRQIENLDNFRITTIDRENADSQIDAFIMLWKMRWGDRPDSDFLWLRNVSKYSLENGNLWLTILWDGETPITGMKAYIDKWRKTFSFVMGGWNKQFIKHSPGNVMLGYSIKYAIENDFSRYDFLMGDEKYKYTFGGKHNLNKSYLIRRTELRQKIKQGIRKAYNGYRKLKEITISEKGS